MSTKMNLVKKMVIVILMVAVLPIEAFAEQEPKDEFYAVELMVKCPSVARLYMTENKAKAQQLAKEMIPSAEKIYNEAHKSTDSHLKPYDCGNELKIFKAIVQDDKKPIEDFMNSYFYQPEDMDFIGFNFGLKEAIAVKKRELALIAAEPVYGPLSSEYLQRGYLVAQLLYAAGQQEQAKSLAKDLLPLTEREENKSFLPFIHNILEDDKKTISDLSTSDYADDSIGRRLEEAYGRIYLYKRLKMDWFRLAYAYRELGWNQAIAGNYDESERAYKTVLRLAPGVRDYPEIPLQIRSELAAVLKLAGKIEEATKLAKGLTPSLFEEVRTKSNANHCGSNHLVMTKDTGKPVFPLGWEKNDFGYDISSDN
jgi:tetratricopeptide (TPR) repeat protein